MEKEIVKTERWRLLCDGKMHWIIPALGVELMGGHTRIEAGGCICPDQGRGLQGREGEAMGADAGRKAPAPQKEEVKC